MAFRLPRKECPCNVSLELCYINVPTTMMRDMFCTSLIISFLCLTCLALDHFTFSFTEDDDILADSFEKESKRVRTTEISVTIPTALGSAWPPWLHRYEVYLTE